MLGYTHRPSPPSADKRWKIVDAAMRRHGYVADSLIEVLHAAQESFGYLSCDALRYIAQSLRIPYSKVFGVATFYNHFQMKPAGKHTCVICTGTACYINGASALLKAVGEYAGISSGETSANGEISLLTARCIGACGLSPVAVVDDEVLAKGNPQKLKAKLQSLTTVVEA